MKEELRKILDLIEQDRITAAQAAELIEAMGIESEQPEKPRQQTRRTLRVLLMSAGGEKVNVKLPVGLLRSGLDIGKHFASASGKSKETLNNLDWDQLTTTVDQMLEDGTTGEIVNIAKPSGERILILLE